MIKDEKIKIQYLLFIMLFLICCNISKMLLNVKYDIPLLQILLHILLQYYCNLQMELISVIKIINTTTVHTLYLNTLIHQILKKINNYSCILHCFGTLLSDVPVDPSAMKNKSEIVCRYLQLVGFYVQYSLDN